MASQLFGLMLFGPGIRYVPEIVWHSRFFWIALVVMAVGSILYHNNFFRKKGNVNFTGKEFNFPTGNAGPAAPKISYLGDGRSGHVYYQSAETKFALYYEFGSGTCVATIEVPSLENWEKQTKLPLARRDEVLDSIGRQVVKDQTTDGRGFFKIEGNWLHIYA